MKVKIFITLILSVMSFALLFSQNYRNFSAEDINSNNFTLSDYIGEKIIVLDFWASWCVPCTRLLPELNKIHNDYEDVLVIGVCIDNPRSVNRAKSIIRAQNYDIVTVYDSNNEIKELYRVTDIPRTFIIDMQGVIVFDHTGYNRGDEEEIRKVIEELIGIEADDAD